MWLKNGLLFGSEMHVATGIVILIEVVFIIYQAFKCLEKPDDKKRKWYFLLLFLLLFYNITRGLFPDSKNNIPLILQYLLCHGGGLAVLAYCPFYFYKNFALCALKFHAEWGVWLFLLCPFFVSFAICYYFTCNLNWATTCGMAIPLIYSFVLLLAIGAAIYNQYANESLNSLKEIILMFISIFPWGFTALMTIVGASQLQELIFANTSFLFFRVFYVKEEFREAREKELNIQSLQAVIAEQNMEISQLLNIF